MDDDGLTVYELVGGDDTFLQLVNTFYDQVERDPALRAIFPDDLEPGKQAQFLFLTQFFGGPQRYSQQRGHPRLRMRHGPYPITQAMRDRWLTYMLKAIDVVEIAEPARSTMREYFERASTHMINRFEMNINDDPHEVSE